MKGGAYIKRILDTSWIFYSILLHNSMYRTCKNIHYSTTSCRSQVTSLKRILTLPFKVGASYTLFTKNVKVY